MYVDNFISLLVTRVVFMPMLIYDDDDDFCDAGHVVVPDAVVVVADVFLLFSVWKLTKTSWTCTPLSLQEFEQDNLTITLEQTIHCVYTHKDYTNSATLLILHDWKHAPYPARSTHSKYVQSIAPVSHIHTIQGMPIHT